MQQNFVIFLSMIIGNLHNSFLKTPAYSGPILQNTWFSARLPPLSPKRFRRFLGNVYNRRGGPPRPVAVHSTRNCWAVTRGWQINALPSRLLSSMGTAVIWLLS